MPFPTPCYPYANYGGQVKIILCPVFILPIAIYHAWMTSFAPKINSNGLYRAKEESMTVPS
jgi:hypothetical protein